MIREAILEFIWIGKQNVVWFSKFNENLSEAVTNTLSKGDLLSIMICDKSNARNRIFIQQLSYNVDVTVSTNHWISP
jgi:hypothetical protein